MLRIFIVGAIIGILFKIAKNLSREVRGPHWLFFSFLFFSLCQNTHKHDLHQDEKLHKSHLSVEISHWWGHSWTLLWKRQKRFTGREGAKVPVNLLSVMTTLKHYFIQEEKLHKAHPSVEITYQRLETHALVRFKSKCKTICSEEKMHGAGCHKKPCIPWWLQKWVFHLFIHIVGTGLPYKKIICYFKKWSYHNLTSFSEHPMLCYF